MKAETYALALWALQEERDKVWTAARYNSEATRQSLEAEIDSFDAAIADLEAEQAAPQSATMADDIAAIADELGDIIDSIAGYAIDSNREQLGMDGDYVLDLTTSATILLSKLKHISQPVAMPRADRIASLEIVMSGLDDYWAIQPEVQGHIANVREWLDELQQRPGQEAP